MALLIPEFLQTKTYSALRDRLAFQHGSAIDDRAMLILRFTGARSLQQVA